MLPIDDTPRFQALWDTAAEGRPLPLARDAHHVLVRGLFGSKLPRHFRAARSALEAMGLRVSIAPSDPVAPIAANARSLARWFGERVAKGDRLVVLAHSRGGLEALLALSSAAAVQQALVGIGLCQTARGPSPALDEILARAHWRDAPLRWAIRALGGMAACREIGALETAALAQGLDPFVARLPAVAVATSSEVPSRSLEAQHRRMARLLPGVAHDGLFRTIDLQWPTAAQVRLHGIDHSQPGVGGKGFDCGRFWLVLAAVLASRAGVEAGIPGRAAG